MMRETDWNKIQPAEMRSLNSRYIHRAVKIKYKKETRKLEINLMYS